MYGNGSVWFQLERPKLVSLKLDQSHQNRIVPMRSVYRLEGQNEPILSDSTQKANPPESDERFAQFNVFLDYQLGQGNYQLLNKIIGNFGEVWKANYNGEVIALKLLLVKIIFMFNIYR